MSKLVGLLFLMSFFSCNLHTDLPVLNNGLAEPVEVLDCTLYPNENMYFSCRNLVIVERSYVLVQTDNTYTIVGYYEWGGSCR